MDVEECWAERPPTCWPSQSNWATIPPVKATSVHAHHSHLIIRNSRVTLHINKLCKSSYYHIRALRHIRSSLPDDICFSLVTALIYSRLDYCNSVLYGTSASNLNKRQVVQNALASSPLSVSGSHLLSDLHWLPVRKRIDFKIATFTY